MYSTVYNVLYSKVYSIVLGTVHEFIPTNKRWQGGEVFLRKHFSSEANLMSGYNLLYIKVHSTVHSAVFSTVYSTVYSSVYST